MAAFLYGLTILAGAGVLLLVLDRVLCWGLRGAARVLPPGDMCGPGGWLIDTDRRNGVFDPIARG